MPRTRTPSELKWLLNERAALAGNLEHLAHLRSVLSRTVELRERFLQTAQKRVATIENRLSEVQATLAALDRSIALMHSLVDPSAAGKVKAWAGKYGKRGNLKAFVDKQIQARAPEPISTTVLLNLVIAHFSVTFVYPGQRQVLRRSIKSALASSLKQGLIQPIHDRSSDRIGMWQWAKDRVPSLAELRAVEQEAEGERICAAQEDPARNQVAGQ